MVYRTGSITWGTTQHELTTLERIGEALAALSIFVMPYLIVSLGFLLS